MRTIKIPLENKIEALGRSDVFLQTGQSLIFEYQLSKELTKFKGVYIPNNFHINISSIKEKSFVNFHKEANVSRTDKITPNAKVYLIDKNFNENDIFSIKLTNQGFRKEKKLIDLVLFFEQ